MTLILISLFGAAIMFSLSLGKLLDKEKDWLWALAVTILFCIIAYREFVFIGGV